MRSFSAISSLLFILTALPHHVAGTALPCFASTVTVTGSPASASTVTVTAGAVSASTVTVTGSPASASTVTVTAGAVSASTVTLTASASTITVTGSPASSSIITVTVGAACSSTFSTNTCSCPTSSSFPSSTSSSSTSSSSAPSSASASSSSSSPSSTSSSSTSLSSTTSTSSTSSTPSSTSSSSIAASSGPVTSTSSSIISSPSGYSSLGCYTEPNNVRALPAALFADDELTVEKCSNYCAGYSYFGVEYSRECWCGNAISSGSTNVDSSQCDMTCDGNQQETCGGPNRLNVYSLGVSPTTLATITTSTVTSSTALASDTTYPYLGCYSEATSTRALSDDHYINYRTMTIEICGSYCEGYSYFGLEYSGECYCGNDFNDGSVSEPETDCDMTCDGDAGEICGGPDRLSVYYYPDEKPSTDCSNIGLQYAAFAEDPEIINRDGVYSEFDPTIYKTTPIEVTGTTTSVSYSVDTFYNEDVDIYGSDQTLGSYYLVIDNRGYLFAQASGTYTFATQSVDDLFLLWIGPLAYSGWTRPNANLEGNLSNQQVSYEIDLVAGQYYPLRFMWVNGDGPGNFEFSITAPDGTIILDADTVASPYLVQFSCDGTSAPAYPAWGSET